MLKVVKQNIPAASSQRTTTTLQLSEMQKLASQRAKSTMRGEQPSTTSSQSMSFTVLQP